MGEHTVLRLKDEYRKFRFLDFDDLSILTLLLEGVKCCDIGKKINLSPPAVCHRLERYRAVWPDLVVRGNSSVRLSKSGKEICKKIKKAVLFLCEADNNDYGSLLDGLPLNLRIKASAKDISKSNNPWPPKKERRCEGGSGKIRKKVVSHS